MKVTLPKQWTSEQLTLLQHAPRSVEIIKGAAGSGKTLTAIMKMLFTANYFASQHRRVNVQVLSFNRTLRGYIQALLSSPLVSSNRGTLDLDVSTFAMWAKKLCGLSSMELKFPKQYLECEAGNDLVQRYSLEFLAEEMEYILMRFQHDNLDAYLTARREGRGNTPALGQQVRQRILAECIEPYMQWKHKRHSMDWSDLDWKASCAATPAYDIIVVDEGQDFSANRYRALMKALKPEGCFICVIDTAQRIYLNGFTWAECGIDAVRNQPNTLQRNFRNTQPIAALAAALLGNVAIDADGVMPCSSTNMSSGPIPVLLEGKFSQQMRAMVPMIKEFLKRNESVAVFIKSDSWSQRAKRELAKAGLHYDCITRESEWPDDDTNLILSTMHSAKGLEFDHVFMPGLTGSAFQPYSEEKQEESDRDRRLLAMAVGRARKTVTLGHKPGETCAFIDALPEGVLQRVPL